MPPKKKKNNANSTTDKFKKQRADVTYDFSCLATENDRGSNKVIFNLDISGLNLLKRPYCGAIYSTLIITKER